MDTMIFIVSKLIGGLLRPDTWLVLFLAAAVLAIVMKRHRLALAISNILLFSTIVFAVFPVGNLILRPLENSFPINPELDKVSGIIVLGGGESPNPSIYWNQLQFSEGGDRFAAGGALARRFPNAKLLFSGGSGALRDLGETGGAHGDIIEQFFLNQGIAKARLLIEHESRNTSENARYSFALVSPQSNETWILVTSAFHMKRAMHSFRSAGWVNLVAWPVDYRSSSFVDGIGWDLTGNLKEFRVALREYVGLIVYQTLGR